MNPIITLAAEMSRYFETRTRDNGARYVTLKGAAPDWMADVVRDGAHAYASLLPDDWRYAFCRDAVDLLSEADPEMDDDGLTELADAWEPDIYTHRLLDYLRSDLSRVARADEALEDGMATDIVSAIQWAQVEEFREVFSDVVSALETVASSAAE